MLVGTDIVEAITRSHLFGTVELAPFLPDVCYNSIRDATCGTSIVWQQKTNARQQDRRLERVVPLTPEASASRWSHVDLNDVAKILYHILNLEITNTSRRSQFFRTTNLLLPQRDLWHRSARGPRGSYGDSDQAGGPALRCGQLMIFSSHRFTNQFRHWHNTTFPINIANN